MAILAPEPQQVFEQLYDRYARDVYRYALAILRNPADAEDVTQTTFMNAYRAIKHGERPEKPHHWLIVIAHNACRTRAIRAARRPREVPLDDAIRDVPVPDAERPNLRAVLEALGRLPFNQRSALVMRELEGRSYEEIAETLGVTVAAVETLIFRARRSLRLRKDALRGLALVQLPASLQAFAPTLVAGGGAFLGGGIALKAAAAVVAAVIAGGATIEAVSGRNHPRRGGATTAATPILFASVLGAGSAVGHAAAGLPQRRAAARRARAGRRGSGPHEARPAGGGAAIGQAATPAAHAGAAGSAGPGAPGAVSTVPLPATTPSVVPVATPTVPTVAAPLPALPLPAAPLPAPPPLPSATVPTPPSLPSAPTVTSTIP